MKKIILVSLTTIFFLSGCFGWLRKEKSKTPQTPQVQTQAVTQTVGEETKPYVPVSPSFQDGDLYWEAISSSSREPCEKIKSQSLRVRCITEVKQQQKK